jgi:CO dehydrogenase maturation factor
MTKTIAISGKGGSGKTTLAAMIVRLLSARNRPAVLAVDADPNACLGITLGVESSETVSEIREKTVSQKPDSGTDRVRSFQYGIQQVITEADGFDLLTIGQPEGPGCYCAANNLLRQFLDELRPSYQAVVIDNEAGMEHLSRRTAGSIDLLIIVAEPTAIGKVTAERILELSHTLPIAVKKIGIIWNKAENGPQLGDAEILGSIPYDESVAQAATEGKTVFDLDRNCPAFSALQKIINDALIEN